ncbi:MAG: hypothetical protein C4332_11490, partial [Meiothermus sp.]
DNSGDFKINLRFVSNISDSQKAAFEQAAARWSQVITVGLPGLRLRFPANDCGEGLPAFDGTIDSLLIDVQVKPIDGPGRILGSSGPCKIRNSSNLPGYGIMTLDATDLNTLETSGQLQATITHEMGHVLGFGTLWTGFGRALATGLGNGASCGGNPQYVGSSAVREWKKLGGAGNIPLEKGSSSADLGTCDSHWRESVFGKELMTGFIDFGLNPLSRVTVGSLEDLGYTVDYSAADPYRLPVDLGKESLGEPLRTKLIYPTGTIDDRER